MGKLLGHIPLAWRETLEELTLSGTTKVSAGITRADKPGEYRSKGVLALDNCSITYGDLIEIRGISGSMPIDQIITTRYVHHDVSEEGYQYEKHEPNVRLGSLNIAGVEFSDVRCYAYLKDGILRVDDLEFEMAEGRFHKGSFSIDFRGEALRFAMLLSFDGVQLEPLARVVIGRKNMAQGHARM